MRGDAARFKSCSTNLGMKQMNGSGVQRTKDVSFNCSRLFVARPVSPFVVIAILGAYLLGAAPVLAADTVYTVGNYPVDAVGRDAVAAKKQAHAEGQQAALRSLLKRLVPVAAYPQLRRLQNLKSDDFVDGIAVLKEQNSTTEYIATMNFTFRPQAVKELLRRQGIPFLDEQAQPVIVVPIYRAPKSSGTALPTAYGQAEGARNWFAVWRDLDLVHALTPVKLQALKREIHPDTISALLDGDTSSYRILTSEYGSEFVILAIAEPEPSRGRLKVTLIGRDAVDFFTMKRSYRIQEDLLYTSELAAVIGLGVLEGRWKMVMAGSAMGANGLALPLQQVRFVVTFASAGQWRSIRKRIAQTAGVEQMEVGGLSARGATVILQYPGGAEQLVQSLTRQGLYLRRAGGGWLLQGS